MWMTEWIMTISMWLGLSWATPDAGNAEDLPQKGRGRRRCWTFAVGRRRRPGAGRGGGSHGFYGNSDGGLGQGEGARQFGLVSGFVRLSGPLVLAAAAGGAASGSPGSTADAIWTSARSRPRLHQIAGRRTATATPPVAAGENRQAPPQGHPRNQEGENAALYFNRDMLTNSVQKNHHSFSVYFSSPFQNLKMTFTRFEGLLIKINWIFLANQQRLVNSAPFSISFKFLLEIQLKKGLVIIAMERYI